MLAAALSLRDVSGSTEVMGHIFDPESCSLMARAYSSSWSLVGPTLSLGYSCHMLTRHRVLVPNRRLHRRDRPPESEHSGCGPCRSAASLRPAGWESRLGVRRGKFRAYPRHISCVRLERTGANPRRDDRQVHCSAGEGLPRGLGALRMRTRFCTFFN